MLVVTGGFGGPLIITQGYSLLEPTLDPDAGSIDTGGSVIGLGDGAAEPLISAISTLCVLDFFASGNKSFDVLLQVTADGATWYTAKKYSSATVTADAASTGYTKARRFSVVLPSAWRLVLVNTAGDGSAGDYRFNLHVYGKQKY